MNQGVQVELIDLAGVELGEPDPHVFEQRSQLALVVGGDQLSGAATIGLVRFSTLRVVGSDPGRKLQRETSDLAQLPEHAVASNESSQLRPPVRVLRRDGDGGDVFTTRSGRRLRA
jgi:hypothetical protein